jgi:hypothetical protein
VNARFAGSGIDAVGGELDFTQEVAAELDDPRPQLDCGSFDGGFLDGLGLARDVRAADHHRDDGGSSSKGTPAIERDGSHVLPPSAQLAGHGLQSLEAEAFSG